MVQRGYTHYAAGKGQAEAFKKHTYNKVVQ